MSKVKRVSTRAWLLRLFAVVTLLLFMFPPTRADATVGYPTAASVKTSDSRPSTSGVTYTFGNTVSSTNSATGIACITVRLATTTTGSSVPSGLDSTGASLNTGSSDYLSSWASWTLDASANGLLKITRSSSTSTPQSSARSIVFTGIVNGDTPEVAYYAQFNTYTNNDCSTGPADTAVVAFIFENGQLATVTVDPALSFTIDGATTGNYNDASHCSGITNGITPNVNTTDGTIPFGTPTVGSNSIGMQRMTVGTNAATGTYVYTWADQQLTSVQNPSKTIGAITASNAVPVASGTSFASGTAGWGYSSSANSTTGVNLANNRFASDKWAPFITTANTDHVFYANGIPVDSSTSTGSSGNYAGGKFCVAYQVGISSITTSGIYTANVIFNVLPTY